MFGIWGNIIGIIDIIWLPVLIGIIIMIEKRRWKEKKEQEKGKNQIGFSVEEQPLNTNGAYQKRWMFTYNEKDAYYKLKKIADELNMIVFSKVRLLDLLEPVKGNPKYKTYFYKIQAKHVDFVLCDQKLVAKYIIELDDNSHDAEKRKERDNFVDEVVTSVGYKIIHVRGITDNLKEQLI